MSDWKEIAKLEATRDQMLRELSAARDALAHLGPIISFMFTGSGDDVLSESAEVANKALARLDAFLRDCE